MADLSALADGLVHDLRNPLNVIRTNAYLLRQRVSGDERALRAVNRIDDQVTVALRTLEDLQAFYRSDRPLFQRADPRELLIAALNTFTIPEGYNVTVVAEPDLPLLSADPPLIYAALRGMLRNAVDAQPANGPILLTAQQVPVGICFSVEDEGAGPPAEALPHLFEPFFTTRRAHAGLGLALVRRVAEAHGGTADLQHIPGRGTVASMTLPVEEAPSDTSA